MAKKEGIRPLDDGALAQVWGGYSFSPLYFGTPGAFGGGPIIGSIPGLGEPLWDLGNTTVTTPHGQASHAGGGGQPDGGQAP